jgi:hypothetical protein
MKSSLRMLALAIGLFTLPLQGVALVPAPANLRLSAAVQSPYDLCFYLEQQQWDQVEAVIKRVPTNYQFDIYKNNTPLMVAIDLYAKRIADKPKTFWQTTLGGAVQMVIGSGLVVLGMATTGGRGDDYKKPFDTWFKVAHEDLDEEQQKKAEAPAAQVPPDKSWISVSSAAHRAQHQTMPKVEAAVERIEKVADEVHKTVRQGKIWGARLLGMAALAGGAYCCWQGGQRLKSIFSLHNRSTELEHYQKLINELLHRDDLNLGVQNNDSETALTLIRRHMAANLKDREAYQLLSDIEQLILIRQA